MAVKPKLKGRQHMDEKVVFVKGKKMYDLNCKDHKTKYITAHLFVKERTKEKCTDFLRQIKTTCYDQILQKYAEEKHNTGKERKLITFVSDKFWNYRNAFNKLFYRVAKLTFGVPIKAKTAGCKYNNNAIERYNGKLDDRLQNMRRGFGSFDGGKSFLNLNHIIHNFVNPHQGLNGKTPAEEAEVNLNLGKSKLLNLIRFARRTIIIH